MKTCSKCLQEKDETEFRKEKKGKNGLSSWCKECWKEYAKTYAQSERGKEVHRQACKRYNASENGKTVRAAYNSLECVKEAKRGWANSESGKAFRAKEAIIYKENGKRKQILDKYSKSEKFRKTLKRYHTSPKGRETLSRGVHKRRSILENVVSDLTADQWEEIKASQKYRCAMCHKKKPLTRDHIIPITKGGQHTASNIQALCRSCNTKKGNRLLETNAPSGM